MGKATVYMGESTVYMGELRIHMDSHVKRILHGDVRFPPCKLIYMVEKRISPARPGFTWGCVSHQLDLGLHGEGDCLDGGSQNLGILMNPRNPNESWES